MVSVLAWTLANTSIKISIVHLYITIFRSNKVFLKAAYGEMILVMAFGIAQILNFFLLCHPFAKNWDLLLPGDCGDKNRSSIAVSACNVAIDLTIIILPMPMIWGLQMATRRKIELTIAFALGFMYVAQYVPLYSSRLTCILAAFAFSPLFVSN